jgi:hypothetical protein
MDGSIQRIIRARSKMAGVVELLGSVGKGVNIHPRFYYDGGYSILHRRWCAHKLQLCSAGHCYGYD